MQDSAVNHIEALGHSLDRLKENKHGWFLSKMHIELDSLPEWKDRIKIVTWQPGVDKIYALRDFLLLDEENKEIGRASSFWVAVDMARKRLVRPEVYLQDEVFCQRERAGLKAPCKVASVSEPDHQKEFFVHENNLDLNGHTNSITYLKWIMKVLKELVDPQYRICDLEINYNGQTFVGDPVMLFSRVSSCETCGKLVSNHSLFHRDSGESICNARFKYVK